MDGVSPGQIIDGRYKVVTALGEGGMGVVFRAEHTDMRRSVAIKLLKPSLLPDPDKVNRFIHEARTISRLKHHNLVNVYSVGMTDNGQPYIAMEYIEGRRLADLIVERGGLAPQEALPLFIQVCDGLAHAHQHQIVHRDIKPSNIMVVAENGVQTAKVVDFGIAKCVAPDVQAMTQTGLVMGSAFYMSPGQCAGRVADVRSDVYSLGCTLFETLTGSAPLQGETFFETLQKQLGEEPPTLREVKPQGEFSPELQAILDCMLQKEPANRYQTMEALKQDLQRVLDGKQAASIPERSARKSEYLKRSPDRRIYGWLAAGVVGVILSGVLVYGMMNRPHASRVDDSEELRARAAALEMREQNMAAIALYQQAIEAANAEQDAQKSLELQHRMGWVYSKEWVHRGKDSAHTELLNQGYANLSHVVAGLEQSVLPVVQDAAAWKTYREKERLTLLLITYWDTFNTARYLHDSEAQQQIAEKYIKIFPQCERFVIDADREGSFYLRMLDFLLERYAFLQRWDDAHRCATLYEAAARRWLDPAAAEEALARHRLLLKGH